MAEKDQSPTPRPITVDESKTVSSYANFCRVTGSPEELIVDFRNEFSANGTKRETG